MRSKLINIQYTYILNILNPKLGTMTSVPILFPWTVDTGTEQNSACSCAYLKIL